MRAIKAERAVDKHLLASAYALNGLPFQMTTSAPLPASSVPMRSSSPRDFAGLRVSQRIARSGGTGKPARAPWAIALAASWFRR